MAILKDHFTVWKKDCGGVCGIFSGTPYSLSSFVYSGKLIFIGRKIRHSGLLTSIRFVQWQNSKGGRRETGGKFSSQNRPAELMFRNLHVPLPKASTTTGGEGVL